ncbi:MAG: divalent-cation tolerance protein CutA [Verrucomicrobia bacterium]|nr:divalent-cation tolerance protein CutA [Verrucomicrobiota bacterium]
MSALLVMSMFPDTEIARTISRTLVEEQLAACANLVPGAESIYWWKGVIESSSEVMAFFKTTEEQYKRFETRLKELHPYEVPEIIALQPANGLPAYLEWVAENTVA